MLKENAFIITNFHHFMGIFSLKNSAACDFLLESDGNWYSSKQAPSTFDDAVATCTSMSYSRVMAVKTSATQEVLEAICDDEEIWLGATDEWVEGSFQWIDFSGAPNENVHFSKWDVDEPNNNEGREDCVIGR